MDRFLAGKTVLVVEDELLSAMELERLIEEAGGHVCGPTGRLAEALALAEGKIDAAVLDARLDGDSSAPLAARLRQRKIPFLLASGYQAKSLPEGLEGAALLEKPYADESFYAAARKHLVGRS